MLGPYLKHSWCLFPWRQECIAAKSAEYAGRFAVDVIVSCEMLEHMKNYDMVFMEVSYWLKPDRRSPTDEARPTNDVVNRRKSAFRLRIQGHRLDGQVLLRRNQRMVFAPICWRRSRCEG
jgi:hypothetical protein